MKKGMFAVLLAGAMLAATTASVLAQSVPNKPARHQANGRSGQTDHGPFDESPDPRLRGPLFKSILDDGYAANPLSASPAPAGRKRGRRKKTKPRNLLERLDERRQEALAFMYDFRVHCNNSLGERDVRMMKVQQKISGRFGVEEGAKAFCRIRSYLSTARKNTLGALQAIARILPGNPFVRIANTT